eukprot:SAG25_NODE_7653_length_468_cov_1.254743_2_plen_31_part_01
MHWLTGYQHHAQRKSLHRGAESRRLRAGHLI